MNTQPEPMPLVSVIMPAYNAERFLAEAIESILAQTYRSYELIVVDDGSTDRTREIVLSYPSVKYLYQANSGTAAARNRGIEIARGEYLAFLDADDLWMPGKLAVQMAAFEADPTLEVVSGHVEQFVNPDLAQKYTFSSAPLPGYSTIAILIKRSGMDAVGLFHEDALVAETISWFSGLIDKDLKILVLPDLVARRRIHGKNTGIFNQRERNRKIISILKNSIDRKRAKEQDQDQLEIRTDFMIKNKEVDAASALARDMDNPLVSVIMVVKNGERFLPSAIDSVNRQGYRPMEIIVVDGQSVDRTAEIAKAIPGVHYIFQPDHGLANARNCAIQVARGEFIAFLDSDDVWAPDKLRTQIDLLSSHPDIQGAVSWLRFFMDSDYPIQNHALVNHYEHDQIGYTPSALVARRDLFSKAGLFDPAFSSGCDADWFARLLDLKLPIVVLPEILLYKRIHDSNLSLNTVQNKKETMLVLRKSLLRKRKNKAKNV